MSLRRAAMLAVVLAAPVAPLAAQSVTTEADVSVGHASEGISAASTAVRLFGPLGSSNWRVTFEGAWGTVSSADSDAFGAAYPYDGRVRPMDAFTERTFRPDGAILGVKFGHYRTPFGISGGSDYAYGGFTRPPLIRYDSIYGLSNLLFEAGADVLVGTPSLSVETSVGTPADVDPFARRHGADAVVRAQTVYHSVILGVSYLNAPPSVPDDPVPGRTALGGLDGRWMQGGVEVRGEWMAGRAFLGGTTRGGYSDLLIHRPGLGPVTIVARAETLDYNAGVFSVHEQRLTAGTHVRLGSVGIDLNLLRQTLPLTNGDRTGVDVGATYTIRFHP